MGGSCAEGDIGNRSRARRAGFVGAQETGAWGREDGGDARGRADRGGALGRMPAGPPSDMSTGSGSGETRGVLHTQTPQEGHAAWTYAVGRSEGDGPPPRGPPRSRVCCSSCTHAPRHWCGDTDACAPTGRSLPPQDSLGDRGCPPGTLASSAPGSPQRCGEVPGRRVVALTWSPPRFSVRHFHVASRTVPRSTAPTQLTWARRPFQRETTAYASSPACALLKTGLRERRDHITQLQRGLGTRAALLLGLPGSPRRLPVKEPHRRTEREGRPAAHSAGPTACRRGAPRQTPGTYCGGRRVSG